MTEEDPLVDLADAILRGESIDWDAAGDGIDAGDAGALENLRLLQKFGGVLRAAPMSFSVPGFQVLQKIGEGGMGVVYEAEQESPRRRVALKILRTGAPPDSGHGRSIQREARALARLQHPNIAAVFTAGTTREGNDYFVLELVRGLSLSEHVKPWLLDAPHARENLRRRIELFLQLLDAVAYAHQRGVIHRDLKPGNVMVSEDGVVKVLDFGLARVTSSEESVAFTMSGMIQGTLAYMSPEQAKGRMDQLDVRTDVYSLGVMLYELISGELPHDVSLDDLASALDTIAEVPAVPVGKKQPLARGDLETIVAKALAKEPDARYEGVAAFAGDLRRYLEGRAITARPATWTYQTKRFVARHRLLVTAVSLVLVTVLGATIGMAILYQQQVVATERSERSNEVLREVLGSVAPRSGSYGELDPVGLLENAQTRIETSSDDPRVVARNLVLIGELHLRAGRAYEARETLDRALELHDGRDADTAQAYESLGMAHLDRGSIEDAALAVSESRERWQAQGDRSGIARTALLEGEIALRRGDLKEASRCFARITGDADSGVSRRARARQAVVWIAAGRFDRAVARFDSLIASAQSTSDMGTTEALDLRFERARALAFRGDLDEGEQELRGSAAALRARYGDDHERVAVADLALARVLVARGDTRIAERMARAAGTLLERDADPVSDRVARASTVTARILRDLGQYDAAIQIVEPALAAWPTARPSIHAARAALLLADIRIARGDLGVDSLLDRAASDLEAGLDRRNAEARLLALLRHRVAVARGQSSEGFVAVLRGIVENPSVPASERVVWWMEAAPDSVRFPNALDEAEALLESTGFDRAHPLYLRLANERAEQAWSGRRFEEAEAILRGALEESSARGVTRARPDVTTTWSNLAAVLVDAGRPSDAEWIYHNVVMNWQWKRFGADHPDNGPTYLAIADVEVRLGRLDRARAYFERSIEVRRSAFGGDDWRTASSENAFAAFLFDQGDTAAARELFARTWPLLEDTPQGDVARERIETRIGSVPD